MFWVAGAIISMVLIRPMHDTQQGKGLGGSRDIT